MQMYAQQFRKPPPASLPKWDVSAVFLRGNSWGTWRGVGALSRKQYATEMSELSYNELSRHGLRPCFTYRHPTAESSSDVGFRCRR